MLSYKKKQLYPQASGPLSGWLGTYMQFVFVFLFFSFESHVSGVLFYFVFFCLFFLLFYLKPLSQKYRMPQEKNKKLKNTMPRLKCMFFKINACFIKKQHKKRCLEWNWHFSCFWRMSRLKPPFLQKLTFHSRHCFYFVFFCFFHETFVVYEIKRSDRKKQKN